MAKGISLRDIERTLNEIYGVKINKDDISRLIASVSEEVEAWKSRKLSPMYVFTYADCLDEANFHLDVFKKKYGTSQRKIVKKAEEFMQYLEPLFELPAEIRICIYTTNSIESVNSALRKVTRDKGSFPSESAVYKILFLRIRELSEKWNKPIKNWKTIREQLISLFGDRFLKYIKL